MEEIRTRRKRNKILTGIELVLVGTGIILIMIVFAFLQSDFFRLEEIVVVGNYQLSSEELIEQSEIPFGVNIFRIHLEQTSHILTQNPRLKKVTISRLLPNKIQIGVEERKPVAIIPYASEFVEVDGQGVVLAKGKQVSSYNLPIVTGAKLNEVKVGTSLDQLELAEVLGAFADLRPEELKEISEINVTSGEGLLLYTIDGMQVRLGQSENVAGKVRFFLSILDEIRSNNIRPGYYIDVSERGYSVVNM